MPEGQYDERVIAINRVAKVVKGGRRFSFTALVVVGDGNGQRRARLRQGEGSARRHPEGDGRGARRTSSRSRSRARRSRTSILGEHDAARVLLKPASPGTGVIAGGAARAILEAAGIHDVLAKSLGSSNAINVARATMQGLRSLRRPEDIAAAAGQVARRGRPRRACSPRTASGSAASTKSPRSRDGSDSSRVTLVRSKIGTKPKHRGTVARARARQDRFAERAARPTRDPRHARPGAAPRVRRGDPVKVHDLKPAPGSRQPKRRVGRGIGGKGGKTAGRGHKGQGARGTVPARFEGGQTPLHRRTPKAKGFKNPFRIEYHVVNLTTLEHVRRERRGLPGHAARARPRRQAGPGQGARPAAS